MGRIRNGRKGVEEEFGEGEGVLRVAKGNEERMDSLEMEY